MEDYDVHGDELIFPSFINPKKRKLYVNIEQGVGHDFIGGDGYNSFTLIHEWLGHNSKEETESWLKKFVFQNNLYGEVTSGRALKPKPRTPPVVENIDLPNNCLALTESKNFIVRQAAGYMHARGFTTSDFEKYNLKVCTDREDPYFRRIIIPFIENGEIIWYQGRAYGKGSYLRYLNPPDVAKSMLVYNIDNLDKVAIITEGPLDAAMVNGLAVMGSAASDWQVTKILNKKPERIIIVPDSDEQKLPNGTKISVGYKGALKTIERFVTAGFPLDHIHVAFVDGGKDLNDIGRKAAVETVQSAKKITFKTLVKFKEKGAESEFLTKHI
jgi:hypothetical protein